MYADIHKHTGHTTNPIEFVQQNLADILTTPLASRLMRRSYGSALFDLVDAPTNATSRVRLYAAVATSILYWAPYVALSNVQIVNLEVNGSLVFEIEGTATLSGQTYDLGSMRILYQDHV